VKAGKIIKIALVSLFALGIMVYLVYAMLFLTQPDDEEVCVDVELLISQDADALFIDKKGIEDLLKNSHVYPKGLLIKEVDTHKIEETIRSNEFVSEVECYKSSNGKVYVNVKQRVPVVFVAPDGKDGYFVDAKGKVIPNKDNVVNLVVASGDIDEKYASIELSGFGQFLQTDEFWNNQIEQIYVQKDRKGKRVVELIPRVGNHIVYLGTIDDYQKKLRRLKVFYERAMDTVGWNKYARVNLEYENQIICTKSR